MLQKKILAVGRGRGWGVARVSIFFQNLYLKKE